MAIETILNKYKRFAEENGERIIIDPSPRDPILYRYRQDDMGIDYMIFPENEESLEIYTGVHCLYDSTNPPDGLLVPFRELVLRNYYLLLEKDN